MDFPKSKTRDLNFLLGSFDRHPDDKLKLESLSHFYSLPEKLNQRDPTQKYNSAPYNTTPSHIPNPSITIDAMSYIDASLLEHNNNTVAGEPYMSDPLGFLKVKTGQKTYDLLRQLNFDTPYQPVPNVNNAERSKDVYAFSSMTLKSIVDLLQFVEDPSKIERVFHIGIWNSSIQQSLKARYYKHFRAEHVFVSPQQFELMGDVLLSKPTFFFFHHISLFASSQTERLLGLKSLNFCGSYFYGVDFPRSLNRPDLEKYVKKTKNKERSDIYLSTFFGKTYEDEYFDYDYVVRLLNEQHRTSIDVHMFDGETIKERAAYNQFKHDFADQSYKTITSILVINKLVTPALSFLIRNFRLKEEFDILKIKIEHYDKPQPLKDTNLLGTSKFFLKEKSDGILSFIVYNAGRSTAALCSRRETSMLTAKKILKVQPYIRSYIMQVEHFPNEPERDMVFHDLLYIKDQGSSLFSDRRLLAAEIFKQSLRGVVDIFKEHISQLNLSNDCEGILFKLENSIVSIVHPFSSTFYVKQKYTGDFTVAQYIKIFDPLFTHNGPASDIIEVQITGDQEEIGKFLKYRPDKAFPNSSREIKLAMSAVTFPQIMVWLHSPDLQDVFRKKPPLDVFLKAYDNISKKYCKPIVFPKRTDEIEDLNTTLYLFQLECARANIIGHQVSRSVRNYDDDNNRIGDAPLKRSYNDFSDKVDDYKALFSTIGKKEPVEEYPDFLVRAPVFNIGSTTSKANEN
jgi:hypothetical protein